MMVLSSLNPSTQKSYKKEWADSIDYASTRTAMSNFWQVRHLFTGTEGANPNHVLFGQDGLIYGTTIYGGMNNTGVVFEYYLSVRLLHFHCVEL